MVSAAEISVVSTAGMASIVVPCCGMLEYTKLCVPSILKHTRPPFELIFLDIGSLDGTAEYLAEMIDAMGKANLWSSPNGRTPAATLYSAVLREINTRAANYLPPFA